MGFCVHTICFKILLSRASEGGLFPSLSNPPLPHTHTHTLHFAGPHKAQGGEGAMPGSPTSFSQGKGLLLPAAPSCTNVSFPPNSILLSSLIHNTASACVSSESAKSKKKTLLFKWKRRKIKFNGLVVLSSPDLLLSLYHRLYSVSIKTSIKTQNCIQRNSVKECT